jgi:hypothetical protein
MSEMEVIRVTRPGFVQISNDAMQDDELTWGARGLLAYLLSLPPGWKTNNAKLIQVSPDGETRVKGYLRELGQAGYLRRRNEGGTWKMRVADQRGYFEAKPPGDIPPGQNPTDAPPGQNHPGGSDPDIETQSHKDTPIKKKTDTSSAAAPLDDLVAMWNLLQTEGLVAGRQLNPGALSAAIESDYDKLTRYPSLQFLAKALGDADAVYQAIKAAKFLRRDGEPVKWFTFRALLSGKNQSGNHYAMTLMDGGYEEEKTSGNGTSGSSESGRDRGRGGAVRSQNGRIQTSGRDVKSERL